MSGRYIHDVAGRRQRLRLRFLQHRCGFFLDASERRLSNEDILFLNEILRDARQCARESIES
jgi:hypothetical protein